MNKTTRLKKPQIPELDKLYRFDDLGGRPKYGGVEMTSDTNIPDFDEIRDETHSMVVAEATARANADVALQNSISTVSSDLAAETSARVSADEAESTARQNADASEALARASADELEASTRQAADTNLQTQIDAIIASSDVKDVVATYAELEAYDTSTLGDNDIIKVLADETQGGAESYYRYHASTDQFTLIGTKAASYTKSETDTLLDTKVDKVTGKQLSTNDYTDAEKTKLAGIEAGAEANVQPQWNERDTTADAYINGGQLDTTGIVSGGAWAAYNGNPALRLDRNKHGANNNQTVLPFNKDHFVWPNITTPVEINTDNIQEKLTAGDNITITNNVISAAGGAKTLTTADYDYPVDNPDRINVSNLAAGLYEIGESSVYVGGTNKREPYRQGENFLIIWGEKSYPLTVGYMIQGFGSRSSLFIATISDAGILSNFYEVLTSDDVINSLTSQAPSMPLSAAQGKYLNDNKADKTAFTGTDGTADGTMGLVPAPATTDVNKYLKADGTWDTVSAGPTVVQTTGTSTTDVMSQKAVSSKLFRVGSSVEEMRVQLGYDANSSGTNGSVAIGRGKATGDRSIAISSSTMTNESATASGAESIAIGNASIASGSRAVAIGGAANSSFGPMASGANSIAFGYDSRATQQSAISFPMSYAQSKGQVQFELNGTMSGYDGGYNGSRYRLISGLYDPQNDHDAATKGYVDSHSATTLTNTEFNSILENA